MARLTIWRKCPGICHDGVAVPLPLFSFAFDDAPLWLPDTETESETSPAMCVLHRQALP